MYYRFLLYRNIIGFLLRRYPKPKCTSHTLMVPVVLLPVSTSSNVVLPHPDGPMMPTIFPGLKYTETPFKIFFVTRPQNEYFISLVMPASGCRYLTVKLNV